MTDMTAEHYPVDRLECSCGAEILESEHGAVCEIELEAIDRGEQPAPAATPPPSLPGLADWNVTVSSFQ